MVRILLIEPDVVLADIYLQTLRQAEYDVVRVADAQAAIFAADERQPDIVILELQLVAHSGIEFLYEFRSYPEWQNVPVIVHSTVPPSEFDGAKVLAQELGITAYHYKPRTSLAALLASVRQQLASVS